MGVKSMSRIAYGDGQYLPHRSATVQIEDRGYQFAVDLLPGAGSSVTGRLSRRLREHYLAHVAKAA